MEHLRTAETPTERLKRTVRALTLLIYHAEPPWRDEVEYQIPLSGLTHEEISPTLCEVYPKFLDFPLDKITLYKRPLLAIFYDWTLAQVYITIHLESRWDKEFLGLSFGHFGQTEITSTIEKHPNYIGQKDVPRYWIPIIKDESTKLRVIGETLTFINNLRHPKKLPKVSL